MKTVATYPGTGTEIVRIIFECLDVNLKIIKSHKEVEKSEHDAVILLGGCDINPLWYGENNHFSSKPQKERDITEWALIRQAMSNKKPIMGICRGMQMIAVAFGGNLYQDIYSQTGKRHASRDHTIVATGKLSKIIPTNQVNSLHHQAVKRAPIGFDVLAKSKDNIIETIWTPGVLGVQFHPELLFPDNPRWMGLFRWFVSGLN